MELCWLLILGYSTVKAVSEAKRLRSPALVTAQLYPLCHILSECLDVSFLLAFDDILHGHAGRLNDHLHALSEPVLTGPFGIWGVKIRSG